MSDRHFILVLHCNILSTSKVKHLLATYEPSSANYIYFSYLGAFSDEYESIFFTFSSLDSTWRQTSVFFASLLLCNGNAYHGLFSLKIYHKKPLYSEAAAPSCTSPGPCLLLPTISSLCSEQMPSEHSWMCLTFWFPNSSFWLLRIFLTFLPGKLSLPNGCLLYFIPQSFSYS